MNQKDVYRNIALYKYFVLFNEPLFRGVIIITSLQALAHMELSDIFLMESLVMVLCLLFDIPAGALADLIGRKRTIVIGQILLIGSSIGFAVMASPLSAWISNIFWAVGISFQSGADKAFLQNTLSEGGIGEQYKDIEGRAVGARFLLFAFCSLAVGPLAEIDLRIPLLLSLPGSFVSFFAAWCFKEPARSGSYEIKKQLLLIKEGFVYSMKKAELRWIIGFCALLMAAGKLWFFTYNPYFETVGIDLKFYGFIFFLLNIIAWFSSRFVKRIEEFLGEERCMLFMILSTGVPILLMGLFPVWFAAYLVLIQNLVRGFITPFLGGFINKHIQSERLRATVLSVRSSSTNAVIVLALAGFGLMTGNLGLLSSLIVLGGTVLVLGGMSFRSYKKIAT